MAQSIFEMDWIERTPLLGALRPHLNKGRYVHFTDVEKIGVNPNKRHLDPHGIYCYSIDYIFEEGESNRYMRRGETFAFQRDFFYVVEPSSAATVIDLSAITPVEVEAIAGRNNWLGVWQRNIRDKSWIETAGDLMWDTVRKLNNHSPWFLSWGQSLKGVDVILDPLGIIHPAEPGAAVFLNPKSYRVVQQGTNPDKSSGNSYTVEYWKDVIGRVWERIAEDFQGRSYWNHKLPHVDFVVEGVGLTAYLGEGGVIRIKYPRGNEIETYIVDQISLNELSERALYDEFVSVAIDLAMASKLFAD